MIRQPIRTQNDHEAALERVRQLWGAKPESPQGEELDALATLISDYEDRRYSIEAPTSAELTAFRIEQQDRSE